MSGWVWAGAGLVIVALALVDALNTSRGRGGAPTIKYPMPWPLKIIGAVALVVLLGHGLGFIH